MALQAVKPMTLPAMVIRAILVIAKLHIELGASFFEPTYLSDAFAKFVASQAFEALALSLVHAPTYLILA